MLINTSVDVHNFQYLATFGILRESLHTEMDEDIIIFMEGPLAEIMVKISPKIYCKYVIMIMKGNPFLYVWEKRHHTVY